MSPMSIALRQPKLFKISVVWVLAAASLPAISMSAAPRGGEYGNVGALGGAGIQCGAAALHGGYRIQDGFALHVAGVKHDAVPTAGKALCQCDGDWAGT